MDPFSIFVVPVKKKYFHHAFDKDGSTITIIVLPL